MKRVHAPKSQESFIPNKTVVTADDIVDTYIFKEIIFQWGF